MEELGQWLPVFVHEVHDDKGFTIHRGNFFFSEVGRVEEQAGMQCMVFVRKRELLFQDRGVREIVPQAYM